MEYEKAYNSYLCYLNKCCDKIKKTSFVTEDVYDFDIKNSSQEINEIIKKHRLKMINIKFEHTMRMVEQVIKINHKLGFKVNLDLVIKVAVLYHDIGRMRQSTWSNTFNDSSYRTQNKLFNNHSEDGYDIFINNNFNIDSKYIPIIGETILHHQDLHIQPKLNYHYQTNLNEIDIDKIVTGKFQLNENEWQIASLIVQLVADIDKTDILYQHLSDDFDMIRDYVYDNSGDTLDNVALNWGISKLEILEYNHITEQNYKQGRIRIPIKNVEVEKLEVPDYMKDMFYNNTWPELRVLIKDKNWNFITILWWRISHFLNQIVFTSNLVNIEESKLLDQIYEKIPSRLKPLTKEAFVYAKDCLINNRIIENKDNIYLKR